MSERRRPGYARHSDPRQKALVEHISPRSSVTHLVALTHLRPAHDGVHCHALPSAFAAGGAPQPAAHPRTVATARCLNVGIVVERLEWVGAQMRMDG
eukprot:scaffold245763_cov31-Tisochrysis_lutea.AAC.6